MTRQAPLVTIVHAIVFFVLCITVRAGYAESFEFNWPAPSEVNITESTSLNGISLEMHMKANFAKRAQVGGYAFAVQDIEVVEVKGVPEEHQAELMLTNSFWPTYLVSQSGDLIGISGIETATENLMLISHRLDPGRVEQTIASTEFEEMLRSRVAMIWKGLVGAIAGMQLESGEKKTRDETVLLYSIEFPVRITIKHLGSADGVVGAVTLQTVIDYDENQLKSFTEKILSRLLGSEATGSLSVEALQQQVSFDTVLSPETLKPHSSVMIDTLSLQTKQGEKLEIRQRTVFEFDWVN